MLGPQKQDPEVRISEMVAARAGATSDSPWAGTMSDEQKRAWLDKMFGPRNLRWMCGSHAAIDMPALLQHVTTTYKFSFPKKVDADGIEQYQFCHHCLPWG